MGLANIRILPDVELWLLITNVAPISPEEKYRAVGLASGSGARFESKQNANAAGHVPGNSAGDLFGMVKCPL